MLKPNWAPVCQSSSHASYHLAALSCDWRGEVEQPNSYMIRLDTACTQGATVPASPNAVTGLNHFIAKLLVDFYIWVVICRGVCSVIIMLQARPT